MKKVLATGVVAILCHVGTASAATPGWCKALEDDASYDLRDLSSTDPKEVIATLVRATCRPTPEATAAAAKIEALRQAWGKKLGMVEDDWADVVTWMQTSLSPWAVPAISVKDYASATPLDQYAVIRAKVKQSGDETSRFEGADYAADMFEPRLSEVGRFALVDGCLDYRPYRPDAPAYYALCQADLDAFDRKKFLTELRGDTAHAADGAFRTELRLRASTVAKRMAAHAADVKNIIATDAQYQKLWDGAAKGRAMYAAVAIDPSLIALAAKLDSAAAFQSRKMFDGCEAATEAALAKVITDKVSASAFKDLARDTPGEKFAPYSPNRVEPPSFGDLAGPILADIPELLYVLNPYVQCHKPDDLVSSFLRGLLAYSPQLRGSRRAALAGMLREKIVLDDLNAKVSYPWSPQPYDTMNPDTGTAGGVVDSISAIEDQADHVLVSFAKVLTKGEDCIESHYSNRVTRVNTDGSLSYELICDKVGIVTFDETPNGMRVLKTYQSLLKKGVQFAHHAGVVVAVWPSKSAKVPSHILGAAVK